MKKSISFIILFLFFTVSYNVVFSLSCKEFSKIPILHDGRVKPLDSFAKASMLFICGKTKIDDLQPIEWLSELFFDHNRSYDRKIFNITDKNIIVNIGAVINSNNKYSLNDISLPILNNINLITSLSNLKQKDRTLSQNNLLDIYFKVLLTLKLSFFMDYILPDFIFENDDKTSGISRYDILKNKCDFNNYTYLEYFTYYKVKKNFKNFLTEQKDLYFFPNNDKTWMNINNYNFNDNNYNIGLDLLNNAAKFYYNYDEKNWNDYCSQIKENSLLYLDTSTRMRINLELLYNNLSPIYLTNIIYFLVFILSFFLLFNKFFNLLSRCFLIIFSLGFLIHFLCILLRILITSRAPIATLFESILFVNFVMSFIAIFLILKTQYNKLVFIYGSGFVCLLQYVVYKYEFDGDSIKILMPVLNTNFWLTVHVITISLGYAFSLISSIIGHIFLYCYAIHYDKKDILFILSNNIISFCILALFFSFLGTILGGIWADQSWGRFWGWDPKENGAMLIVLWLVFLLHLRFTDIFSPLLLAICAIFINIVVALAWFGVNLLNAGLHSYGFVQNVGENLFKFCVFELIFIFVFTFFIAYRRR